MFRLSHAIITTVVLAALLSLSATADAPVLKLGTDVKGLILLPTVRQATNYTCGIAALQSILYYYGEDNTESELAEELKADPEQGTAYKNIADYAKKSGYTVRIKKQMTYPQLTKLLDAGTPVLLLVQAWTSVDNVDWANDWDDGHYVVAIGHDAKNIYLMDPSMFGNYAYVPIAEFMDRWHDTDGEERLTHFGMTITKPTPTYAPDNILKME